MVEKLDGWEAWRLRSLITDKFDCWKNLINLITESLIIQIKEARLIAWNSKLSSSPNAYSCISIFMSETKGAHFSVPKWTPIRCDMDKSLSPLALDVTYLRFGLLWTHKRNICLIGYRGVTLKMSKYCKYNTCRERLLKILHWQADFSFWPICQF